MNGEMVMVQGSRGKNIYRSTCVKQCREGNKEIRKGIEGYKTESKTRTEEVTKEDDVPVRTAAMESDDDSTNVKLRNMKVTDVEKHGFESSQEEKLNVLIANGTFQTTTQKSIPTDTRIFGSRFIDQL